MSATQGKSTFLTNPKLKYTIAKTKKCDAIQAKQKPVGKRQSQHNLKCVRGKQTGRELGQWERLLMVWEETEN